MFSLKFSVPPSCKETNSNLSPAIDVFFLFALFFFLTTSKTVGQPAREAGDRYCRERRRPPRSPTGGRHPWRQGEQGGYGRRGRGGEVAERLRQAARPGQSIYVCVRVRDQVKEACVSVCVWYEYLCVCVFLRRWVDFFLCFEEVEEKKKKSEGKKIFPS